MKEDRPYTLEDAIKEERRLVNVNKSLYEVCTLKEKNKHFLREAEKHRQKAEWLEELQELREKQSAKTSNKCEGCKAWDDTWNECHALKCWRDDLK